MTEAPTSATRDRANRIPGDTSCSCDDGSTIADSITGTETVRFSTGIGANQVIATDDGGCALTCDVSQNTVDCQGATCQYDGFRATISTDVYTVVGSELNEVVLVDVAIDSGPTCQCVQTGNVLVRAP